MNGNNFKFIVCLGYEIEDSWYRGFSDMQLEFKLNLNGIEVLREDKLEDIYSKTLPSDSEKGETIQGDIVSITEKEVIVEKDDGIRESTSMESLSKLKPASR